MKNKIIKLICTVLSLALLAASQLPVCALSPFDGMYDNAPTTPPTALATLGNPVFEEGATVVYGIDVSRWNGTINWQKLKENGVRFAMIRAGYGTGEGAVDVTFETNIKGALAAGIDVGVYWFSYALNEKQAVEEAQLCINTIKKYKIVYPVVYDFEYASVDYASRNDVKISKSLASAMARAFLNCVSDAGYIPMLYTNLDFSNQYFEKELLSQYDLWWAAWGRTRPANIGEEMWQYTDSGQIPGISGVVDIDYSFKDYTAEAFLAEEQKKIEKEHGSVPRGYTVYCPDTDGFYCFFNNEWARTQRFTEDSLLLQNRICVEMSATEPVPNGGIAYSSSEKAYFVTLSGIWSLWEPYGEGDEDLSAVILLHNRLAKDMDEFYEGKIQFSLQDSRYYVISNRVLRPYEYIRGDADISGSLKIADAMKLFHIIAYADKITDAEKARCDINLDGSVTVADSMRLFAYISGKSKEL